MRHWLVAVIPLWAAFFMPAQVLPPGETRVIANMTFVNLAAGQAYEYLGKRVVLKSIQGDSATVEVDGQGARIPLARLTLPIVLNGVRVFVSDTRIMANLTPNPSPRGRGNVRGAVTKDALLCLSDPAKPLLDPQRYTFPVDRSDGFDWEIGANSHTFAFLDPDRQHEGTDIPILAGRTAPVHALVAIEDARVLWAVKHSGEQVGVLLESRRQPGIYYHYQHLSAAALRVSAGESVKRGQKLGYIWGDNRWGHLHFTIGAWGAPPAHQKYEYAIAAFPLLYELWYGDLHARPRQWSYGAWTFARPRAINGNVKHMGAFNELLGYGWILGDWCPAAKVPPDKEDVLSALPSKTLFAGTSAAATNPQDHYDFEIAVPHGRYALQALLGAANLATWQRVFFEGVAAGTYDLEPSAFAWTPERIVRVGDGRLTIRLHLRDATTPAGLSEIMFAFVDRR